MIEEKFINNEKYRYTGIANYWISEYGNVINFNNYPLKIMKPFITNDFHLKITLSLGDGRTKKMFIHRLVYKAFIGPLIDGLVIEHLDSNPMNNHYTNLKQSTQKENIQTAINYGTFGNNKKNISIYDTHSDKIYTFNKIANCALFCKLPKYVDSKSGLKRSSIFNNRFKILEENNIEGASTIETIYPDVAGIEKGVEYNKGETPLVTFNII